MGREICIIEDFIVPKLNDRCFGNLLEWEDEVNGIFRVFWSHKSGRKWRKEYFLVFTEWDKIKGRKNHGGSGYYTEAKGRFRSALTRLKNKIKTLSRESHFRRYQLKMFQRNLPVSALKKDYNAFNSYLKDEPLFKLEARTEEEALPSASCDSKILTDDLYVPQIKNEVLNYGILNDQTYNFHSLNNIDSFQPNLLCSPSLLHSETETLDQNNFYYNSVPHKDGYAVLVNSNGISTENGNNCNSINWEYTYDKMTEYGLNSIYDNLIPPMKIEQNFNNTENYIKTAASTENDFENFTENDTFTEFKQLFTEEVETLKSSLIKTLTI